MTLSVAYLKRLGSCWSQQELEEAARSWPSPEPPWAFFLGERLSEMSRTEAQLRVQMAAKHIAVAKLRAPVSPGALCKWFREASDVQFEQAASALAAWLDAPADGELFTALSGILAEAPGLVGVSP